MREVLLLDDCRQAIGDTERVFGLQSELGNGIRAFFDEIDETGRLYYKGKTVSLIYPNCIIIKGKRKDIDKAFGGREDIKAHYKFVYTDCYIVPLKGSKGNITDKVNEIIDVLNQISNKMED